MMEEEKAQESSEKTPVVDLLSETSDEEDTAVMPNIQPEQATRDASEETAVDEEDGEDANDNESFWEDVVELSEGDGTPITGEGEGACTVEEANILKARLRTVGEDRFLRETVVSGLLTARKLLAAFGIKVPEFLGHVEDQDLFPLLEMVICRELSKRSKLPQYNTLSDVVTLLQKSQNVIVLTGAGISTSLGIPDFRSKEGGFYARLADMGLSDPQEVFDIHLFRHDPTLFYSVAKDILPSSASNRHTPTHAFIRLLQDQGKLLTNFTQNVDNLEANAGISPDKLIQCHGSFATATCLECRTRVPGEAIYSDIRAGQVARCEDCLRRIRLSEASGLKRKRPSPTLSTSSSSKGRKKRKAEWEDSSDDGEDDDIPVAGVMKPDITFFGEDLPSAFHTRLLDHDREKVDLVLVIGTSLKVAPVSEVVGVLPKDVPQVFINREGCAHVDFDVELLGECDLVVEELARRAGWRLRHEMCGKASVVVEAAEGSEHRWRFRRGKAEVEEKEDAKPASREMRPMEAAKPDAQLGAPDVRADTKALPPLERDLTVKRDLTSPEGQDQVGSKEGKDVEVTRRPVMAKIIY